ncbi:hypothetical protein STEG23_008849, partial [Scotinomys teguina]
MDDLLHPRDKWNLCITLHQGLGNITEVKNLRSQKKTVEVENTDFQSFSGWLNCSCGCPSQKATQQQSSGAAFLAVTGEDVP